MRKRMSREERKGMILDCARAIFTEQGFSATTMEDVVKATGLSKGGLYHYYKSTDEMLYDLMALGVRYRAEYIERALANRLDGADVRTVAEQVVEKMVDANPYMPVYVDFLLAKRDNPKLEALFLELKEEARADFRRLFGRERAFFQGDRFELLTHVINAMIMASEVLGAREVFEQNRATLVAMVEAMFERE